MKRAILFCILTAVAAFGQQPPERVGRIGYIFGEVSFRAGAADEWARASVNDPLSDGDQLRTAADSQADVHVAATAVHLAPRTGLSVVLLDNRIFRVGLSEGALNVRIPRMNEGEIVEVQTSFGTFRLLGVG